MSRRGFTLVEMLVVIAVLAALAALAVPAWLRSREQATAVRALAHIRSLGQACALYIESNRGTFPQSSHQRQSWVKSLRPYFDVPGATPYRSPGDPVDNRSLSYAINDFLTAKPYGERTLNFSNSRAFGDLSQTLLFAETADEYSGGDHFHFADAAGGGYSPAAFREEVAVARYDGSGLYLFADGHAEMRPWTGVRPALTRVGSRFIRPDGNRRIFPNDGNSQP